MKKNLMAFIQTNENQNVEERYAFLTSYVNCEQGEEKEKLE